jgi:hypothetical protein
MDVTSAKTVKLLWCIQNLGGEILRKVTTWKTVVDK